MGRACALAEMNDYNIPAKHKDREILQDKIIHNFIFTTMWKQKRIQKTELN